MSIPKDIAKKIGHFHSVSPDELEDFHEHVEWLEALLHEPCSIWEEDDGELVLIEIRQLVESVNGLKIEIYSNEHPPPHFHVKSPNINASFCIENCDKINGKISRGDYLKIKYWHQYSKGRLIEVWDSTRPVNCVVGEYRGT